MVVGKLGMLPVKTFCSNTSSFIAADMYEVIKSVGKKHIKNITTLSQAKILHHHLGDKINASRGCEVVVTAGAIYESVKFRNVTSHCVERRSSKSENICLEELCKACNFEW